MSSSALFVLPLVICISPYHALQDYEFYSYISQDITTAADYLGLIELNALQNNSSRFVRDAEGSNGKEICCKSTPPVVTAANKQIMSSCKQQDEGSGMEMSKEDRRKLQMKNFACSAQCVGNKMGVVDADGNVKPEEFKKTYMSIFNDPDLKEVTEKAVVKCCPIANQAAKKIDTAGSKCNAAFGMAMMCTKLMTIANCPDAKSTKSPKCEEIKKKIDNWQNKAESEKS